MLFRLTIVLHVHLLLCLHVPFSEHLSNACSHSFSSPYLPLGGVSPPYYVHYRPQALKKVFLPFFNLIFVLICVKDITVQHVKSAISEK